MPKQREERLAKWKGTQPQHTKLRRAENDPNQPPLLPLFADPLSAQLTFYGQIQLSSRLSKKIKNLTKTQKAYGG